MPRCASKRGAAATGKECAQVLHFKPRYVNNLGGAPQPKSQISKRSTVPSTNGYRVNWAGSHPAEKSNMDRTKERTKGRERGGRL